jgi:hypothetical protein
VAGFSIVAQEMIRRFIFEQNNDYLPAIVNFYHTPFFAMFMRRVKVPTISGFIERVVPFLVKFRISKGIFHELLNGIEMALVTESVKGRKAIPVEKMLLMWLWYMVPPG